MVTSLLLSLGVAILLGWWATWREGKVTIASLREQLERAEAELTTTERLRQNRVTLIQQRVELTRLQAEAAVLAQRIKESHP